MHELRVIDCLGVGVTKLSGAAAFAAWVDHETTGQGPALPPRQIPRLVFFVNAHTLNIASQRPSLMMALNQADLVLNDGIGLDLYAWLARRRFDHNFTGTDLVPALFAAYTARQAAGELPRPLRVFLYGAKPGRAEAAAAAVASAYPGIEVVGAWHGYHADDNAVLAAIDAAHPDLLLVGLGNPAQEEWLVRRRGQLNCGVAMGIGALIDFLSGGIPRAPRLLRSCRLEWLFRLALEPRRMFGRYVIGIPLFLGRSVRYLFWR